MENGRTKLKQTEVDCEYLKRCCETLTQENRRLQKELQELRALKTSQPFYMQLPATTLTMCPSCERVATTTTNSSTATGNGATNATATTATNSAALSLSKARLYPFPQVQAHMQQAQTHQAASWDVATRASLSTRSITFSCCIYFWLSAFSYFPLDHLVSSGFLVNVLDGNRLIARVIYICWLMRKYKRFY